MLWFPALKGFPTGGYQGFRVVARIPAGAGLPLGLPELPKGPGNPRFAVRFTPVPDYSVL